MRNRTGLYAATILGIACFTGADWAQFRGTDTTGKTSETVLPPTEWTVKTEKSEAKNIAWSVDLPSRGVSSPIVVGNRVFVTSASGAKQDRLVVACYSTTDGKQLWQRKFWATGRTFCHPTSSVAAPTPASDGRRIFAFFSSNDLACLDVDGNLLWYRGLTLEHPAAANDVGMAASPLVAGDTVVVQLESKGDSFAMGIDSVTGETRWKVPRTSQMNWTSPTLFKPGRGEPLVLLQSPDKLTAHNARTGEVVWTYDSKCAEISSVTTEGETIYIPGEGLTALKVGVGSSNWEKIWQESALAPGSPSPVVTGGRVYIVNRAGVMTCGEAQSGKVQWKLRVKGPYWATPLAIGDLLYVVNQDGLAQVVRTGEKDGEVVASNDFGEPVFGSPAYAAGALYFRGDKHLWKIAAP
ncbi:MAG: PQQ-like beta-propeller repeat protein [Planctomycetia bacterium]|nr:PQQ-like beta-propeller repeat protein [Planctomycetia bacterium]